MIEPIKEGQVMTGQVIGIQPYGAFVKLNENVQGLVHISELTNGFVQNIHDYISVDEEVKVKVLSVDENAQKYALSMRAT